MAYHSPVSNGNGNIRYFLSIYLSLFLWLEILLYSAGGLNELNNFSLVDSSSLKLIRILSSVSLLSYFTDIMLFYLHRNLLYWSTETAILRNFARSARVGIVVV